MSPQRPCCSSPAQGSSLCLPPSSPFPRRLLLQPPWEPRQCQALTDLPNKGKAQPEPLPALPTPFPSPNLAPEHDWSSCPGSGSATFDTSAGRPSSMQPLQDQRDALLHLSCMQGELGVQAATWLFSPMRPQASPYRNRVSHGSSALDRGASPCESPAQSYASGSLLLPHSCVEHLPWGCCAGCRA